MMEQDEWLTRMVPMLERLHAEFGNRLKPDELLVFMAIAASPNISVPELEARLPLNARQLDRTLERLTAAQHFWQRRKGLIFGYWDTHQQPAVTRCGLTLKGALVARGLYLFFRGALPHGTEPAVPSPPDGH